MAAKGKDLTVICLKKNMMKDLGPIVQGLHV